MIIKEGKTNVKYLLIVIILAVIIGGAIFHQVSIIPKSENFFTIENLKGEKNISEQEAINLVINLPEVKEWLALFMGSDNTSPTTGGKPVIELSDKSDEEYIIHVYEKLSDHTATFNWYVVNLKTGKIEPEF